MKVGDARVLRIDNDWNEMSRKSKKNPEIAIDPFNRAYVIYTSGSTGKPKGVQIPHLPFMNFIVTMGDRPGLSSEDVLLSVTTLSFDICGLELWLPLIRGATLVIADKEVTTDGVQLLRLLLSSKATMMQATPISWRLMLGAGWQAGSRDLKILCGGEPLPPELAQQMAERGKVWNMYGPTETTVWSTIHPVQPGERPVSIGLPIANTYIYLLDLTASLVPLGGAGELIIGGEGLARGYHNRPDLTAQQFIPNPYSGIPGDRMYKTGDLSRYLPNRNLECFGRIDHQVKVRGYRIELGEIESTILKHETVKQAVVVVREDSPGDKMLVGYVKTTGGRLDLGLLRPFMKEFLPHYMIPSAIVEMEEFPLTPNGKIDKKQLPAPDWSKVDVGSQYMAPRTAQEELLADIWVQVLRIPKIGINDSFFDLGGQSLVAAQLISRVREALQVEIPQSRFFREPTIAGMAQLIDAVRNEGQELQAPPILRTTRDGDIPLSSNQRRLWFIDQVSPGNSAYNVPTILRIKGVVQEEALQKTLETIVDRHEALRTSLVTKDGVPIQVIADHLEVVIEHQDFSTGGKKKIAKFFALKPLLPMAFANFSSTEHPSFTLDCIKLAGMIISFSPIFTIQSMMAGQPVFF